MKAVSQLDSIKEQWQENPRLRIGCWCILCIFLYLGYESIVDAKLAVQERCLEQNEQIIRLQQLAGEEGWGARRDQLKEQRNSIEERLISAESRGLVQATTQTWLATLLQKNDVKHRRVKVTPPVPLPKLSSIWQVSGTLEGDFTRKSLFQVLLELESADHLVKVDRLEIRGNKKQRFVMDVTVFCRIADH